MALKKRFKKLIIGSESNFLYSSKRFLEEGNKLGLKTQWLNPFQSHLKIGHDAQFSNFQNTLYLNRISGTRLDDFDFIVADHYKQLGAKISNPSSSMRIFRDKDRAQFFLQQFQLNPIPSFFFRGEIPGFEIFEHLNSEKFVVKMFRGNQGVGVNLLESRNSLESFLETFKSINDQKMIIQPFLPHKKEYRVFVCMGQILGIIEKKIDTKEFRANAKRSTLKFLTKTPNNLSSLIEKCLETVPLHYYGIDMMIDEQGPLIIEINPVPGFEHIEKLSKVNIAKNVLQSIIN